MHVHVPRCDCAECLPGFPAAPTPVRYDTSTLYEAETPEEREKRLRRKEQVRAASRRYEAKHPERSSGERAKSWREANPEKVKLAKLVERREIREEREAERLAESTAAE